MSGRCRVLVIVVAATFLMSPAAPALADPPGPTDYQSSIVNVEPTVAGVEASIIAGDSFFQIRVDPGTEVVVYGYQGEPYLRYLADGTVEENRVSPTKYQNEDRYAVVELPEFASYEAEPEWVAVASDGRYAWHDHRSHWMSEARPLGSGPGDQILEAVVPVEVDGEPVLITVISVWEPAPSPAPWILGGVLGAAVVVLGLVSFGALRGAAYVTLLAAVAALVVGFWEVRSVPAETGPSPLLWAFPLLAVVLVGSGLTWWRDRLGMLSFVAGVGLVVWAVPRLGGLTRAILPTSLPFWLDRAVTAGVLVAAGVSAVVTIVAIACGATVERSGSSSSSGVAAPAA